LKPGLDALTISAYALALLGGSFALPLYAWFFKILAVADFTEDTVLLYFAGEPAQQAFEAFITTGDHI